MDSFKEIQANQDLQRHNHDGFNSEKISGRNLINSPTTALTSANATTPTTADAAIISNMRIRINELETRLQLLGLLR